MATELELRKRVIDVMKGWLGYSEANGKFKEIIDIYNRQKPLPAGYKVKYTDEWCAREKRSDQHRAAKQVWQLAGDDTQTGDTPL